jgi:predicted Zn finger-like uncharacterized protein
MKVSCPSCSANLNIDDKKIPAGGARIKCPSCQNVFPVKPASTGAVPLPGSAAAFSGSVPLPGASRGSAAVPLPGSAPAAAGAVPLPGSNAWDEEPTRSVPAYAGSNSVPLPGGTGWDEESTKVSEIPSDLLQKASRLTPLPATAPENTPTQPMAAIGVVPLPGAAAPARAPNSIPLPGSASPQAPTPDNAIPLPGGAPIRVPSSGVPLPGASSSQSFSAEATAPIRVPSSGVPLPGAAFAASSQSGAIPLPGNAPPSSGVPLPGGAFSASRGSGAIPLPGGAPIRVPSSGVPLPGAAFETSSERGAIPLPGHAPVRVPSSGVPLPGASQSFASSRSSGVPLPGSAADTIPEVEDSDFAEVPSTGGFDFDAAPAPASNLGQFDFSEPAPAGSGQFSIDTAPPAATAPGFDFSDAAPPATAGSGQFGFDEPAAPVSAPASFDFSEPPAASAPAFDFSPVTNAQPASAIGGGLELDLGAPPPAVNAPGPTAFGEVDFGGSTGDLEFDPSQMPGRASDSLEADLNSSLPPPPQAPSGPADGLEMLSFIDDTAKDAGAKPETAAASGTVKRFQLRRRSGKVFGPFEEPVVLKMLEDGQLLGNEEISLDGEAWQPIGSEAAFQAVIAKLMASPSSGKTAPALPNVEPEKPKGPSMEKLQQLYEGRMAAVAVVSSKEPVPFKKRLPYIIGGVAIATILAVGIGVGLTTPYGYFGLKVLLPASVGKSSREGGYLAQAKKNFLDDTYKGYVESKKLAEQTLTIKEYPEARAVWIQAVSHLKRRYNQGSGADIARISGDLGNVRLLGETHPEVLKAKAAVALLSKRWDEATQAMNQALADQSNKDDLELNFLRAEAALGQKQVPQAKSEYEQILKRAPTSAKALHALGLLLKAGKDLDGAKAKFEEALKAAPTHLASAVELAELAVTAKADAAATKALLAPALADDAKTWLSPQEMSRALALKGELVAQEAPAEGLALFEKALEVDANNPFVRGRLGSLYLTLNEPEKATPHLKAAAEATPDDFDLTVKYLSALLAVGKMDEANKVVAAAGARFPGNSRLLYLAGRVADALDNRKDAEDNYRKALAADENSIESYVALAKLLIRSRRFADAKPELEKGLAKEPTNASLHAGTGELALRERDLGKAETEFKEATTSDPLLAEGFLGLSRVRLEQGRNDEALALITKALALNSRLEGGRLHKAVVAWKLGKLDEASAELEEAKKLEPRNLQVIVTTGAVALDRGQFDVAITALKTALQQEPAHGDANFYLARVHNKKSEHTQAIEAIRRALDQNAKNPLYHYWYGRILADARKLGEALEEWKIALDLDPKYVDAMEARGRLFSDRNEFKRAVDQFNAALALDTNRTSVRAALGEAQIRMEDWDAAIKTLTQVVAADPNDAESFEKLATAYQEKKDWTKAIANYVEATKRLPDAADAWKNLGWLYKETNQRPLGVAAFGKYLELRPDARDKKQIDDEILFLKTSEK